MVKHITMIDSTDAAHMAENLSVLEIMTAWRNAEERDFLYRFYHDTPYETPDDSFPWADFAVACDTAISLKQLKRPKTHDELPKRKYRKVNVNDIKHRNDIIDIVGAYIRLKPAGAVFKGLCPIHKDSNPSFTIYPDQQRWHCYGCQRGGDVIKFIQEIENVDFRGAISILGAPIGIG